MSVGLGSLANESVDDLLIGAIVGNFKLISHAARSSVSDTKEGT